MRCHVVEPDRPMSERERHLREVGEWNEYGWEQEEAGDAAQGNGRLLFVAPPEQGRVPLGIHRVYTKYLSPGEARIMAEALLLSADLAEVPRG
jgi:hypothetical protein